jgi:hypothetical protein
VTNALPCTSCGGRSDLASWLDAAHPKLAAEWVRAACPRCEAEAHLALRPGEAAIGTLSPAPAMFRPERRIAVGELGVTTSFAWVVVTLAARRWRFER